MATHLVAVQRHLRCIRSGRHLSSSEVQDAWKYLETFPGCVRDQHGDAYTATLKQALAYMSADLDTFGATSDLPLQMGEMGILFAITRVQEALTQAAPTHRIDEIEALAAKVPRMQDKLWRALYGLISDNTFPYTAPNILSTIEPLRERPLAHCAVRAAMVQVPYGGTTNARIYGLLLNVYWHLTGAPADWLQHMAELAKGGGRMDTRRLADPRRCAELLYHVVRPLNSEHFRLTARQVQHFAHFIAEGTPVGELGRIMEDNEDDDQGRERGHGRLDIHDQSDSSLLGPWYSECRRFVVEVKQHPRSTAQVIHVSDTETYTVAPAGPDLVGLDTQTNMTVWECVTTGPLARYQMVQFGSRHVVVINRSLLQTDDRPVVLRLSRDKHQKEKFSEFFGRALTQLLTHPPPQNINQILQDMASPRWRRPKFVEEVVDVVARKIKVRNCHPATLQRFLAMGDMKLPQRVLDQLSEADPCLNMVSLVGRLMDDEAQKRGTWKHVFDEKTSVVPMIRAAMKHHVDYKTDDPLAVLGGLVALHRHDFDGTWTWSNAGGLRGTESAGFNTHVDAFTVTGQHVVLHHPVFAGYRVASVRYGDESLSIFVCKRGDSMRADMEIKLKADSNNPLQSYGFWRLDHGVTDFTPCSFIRQSAARVQDWGTPRYQRLHPALCDMLRSWQAADFRSANKDASQYGQHFRHHAFDLICSTFPAHVPSLGTPNNADAEAFQVFLSSNAHTPGLWLVCCDLLLKQAYTPRLFSQLDAWILPDKNCDLTTLTGIRKDAAAAMVRSYVNMRKCLSFVGTFSDDYSRVPPKRAQVAQLQPMYAVDGLLRKLDGERDTLQHYFDHERISNRDLTSALLHRVVHEANGLQFRANITADAFRTQITELERMRQVYNTLVMQWGVVESDRMRAEIDGRLSNSMAEELCNLKKTVAQWRGKLSKFMTTTHLISSQVFKAHFAATAKAEGARPTFERLHDLYEATCMRLRGLSLDTTIGAVTEGLPLERTGEGYRQQEAELLQSVGVDPAVVRALLEGAVPLQLAVHELKAFRELVRCPPPELALRDDFLDDREQVLLQDSVDDVLLRDAHDRMSQISDSSCGCDPRILKIIGTMLTCGPLVRFTRDNPSAQDAGLADVLSNTRDIQHASFQAFLNCAPFVNPFVAASREHLRIFYQSKAAAEEEEGKTFTPAEAAKHTRLRLCINNRTSDDPSTQPEGFWELLKTAFGDDVSVANVQASIEKMSAEHQIESLEKIVNEQNTVTDRMIDECAVICGIERAGRKSAAGESAAISIYVPVTGTPSFTVRYSGGEKMGAEYDDLVFRATLQQSIDPVLETFIDQAGYVTQVVDMACRLFAEGHIEFRSRELRLRHDEAEAVLGKLRALLGRWSDGGDAGASLLGEACGEYPALSGLSSAELVQLADLLRGVGTAGPSVEGALTLPWRDGRVQYPPRRSNKDPAAATVVQPMRRQQASEDTNVAAGSVIRLRLDNCGAASGTYSEALYMYRRNDGAVFAPTAQGWVLYIPKGGRMARHLASTSESEGCLSPWMMDKWYETDEHGMLAAAPSKTQVQAERRHNTTMIWSEERQTDATRFLSVRTMMKMNMLPTRVVDGLLYVAEVEAGSVWEARGFEEGMRVVGVSGMVDVELQTEEGASPKELQGALERGLTTKDGSYCHFSVQVVSAWVWDSIRLAEGLFLDENCRHVQCKRRTAGRLYATSPAPGNEQSWRVRLTGNVDDMVVGLVPADCKVVDADSVGVWFARDGSFWKVDGQGDREMNPRGAFKEGDILSVRHARSEVEFAKNGEVVGRIACAAGRMHPCVGLAHEGCGAYLIQGEPVHEVLRWAPGLPPTLEEVRSVGSAALTKDGRKGCLCALGDTIFRGPGPHTFRVNIRFPSNVASTNAVEAVKNIRVGLASPLAARAEKVTKSTDVFAFSVNAEGSVYDSKGAIHTGAKLMKPTKAQVGKVLNYTLVFTVDLGDAKSVQVRRQETLNGRLLDKPLVDTASFNDSLDLGEQGALCPAVWFEDDCSSLIVELLKRPGTDVGSGAASLLVKDSRKGLADGLYTRWLPTLTRSDGMYSMQYWSGRWLVADPAGRPAAWSCPVKSPETFGQKPLKWTVVEGFEPVPHYVRIVTPTTPGGVLELQSGTKGGKVWYANSQLVLLWRGGRISKWIVADRDEAQEAVGCKAYYSSLSQAAYPHLAVAWMVGRGTTWENVCDVTVAACHPDEELRVSRGLVWDKVQWADAKSWRQAQVHEMKMQPLQPVVNIQTHVVSADAAQGEDVMMPDELVGWHLIKKAVNVEPSVAQLRTALLATLAHGPTSGTCVDLAMWSDEADAQACVADAAKKQLAAIGELLRHFECAAAPTPKNFDLVHPWYGPIQGKSIAEPIVDVRQLPMSDRKLFVLSMFAGDVRPLHFLDCTADVPAEDVRTFVAFYRKAVVGRFVVYGLQMLRTDAQLQVRQCLEHAEGMQHDEKGLYAIITGGDTHDETVEFVDGTSCNVQWRRMSSERVVKLSKFSSITYFAHGPGEGKSFAIERQIEEGRLGLPNVEPTRLDLDSTTRGLDDVCERLLAPFLRPEGLLLVHVAHDTDPEFLNMFFDHLVFFGSVRSHSGRYASVTPGGWHLVVEFQTPPEKEPGHTVNPQWRTASGQSDITLLATRDLAREGRLEPYDVKRVDPLAANALQFLRKRGRLDPWVVELNDEKFLRLLASGYLLQADRRRPDDLDAVISGITARTLTRTLRYAVAKFKRYDKSKTDNEWESDTDRHVLVARAMIHEMNVFVNTDATAVDHFHVFASMGRVYRHEQSLLSGSMPAFVKEGCDVYQKSLDIRRRLESRAGAEQIKPLADGDHPMVSLLNMLFNELGINPNDAALCLADKSYALTADFLQKILQLNSHIQQNDPVILQGPSGTGKSYAVMMLSELFAIPAEMKVGRPDATVDLEDALWGFLMREGPVAKLLGQTTGDIKDNNESILQVGQINRKKMALPIEKCLSVLKDSAGAHAEEIFNVIKQCIRQYIGPKLKDPVTYPDLVDIENKMGINKVSGQCIPKLWAATEPKEIAEHATSVLQLLHGDLKLRVLLGELVTTLKAALMSQKMQELTGSYHEQIARILAERPLYDALQRWARKALSPELLGRPGQLKGEALCNAVKDKIWELLHASSVYNIPPQLHADLARMGTLSQPTTGDELADLIAHAVSLKPTSPNVFALMRYDMTPEMLFAQCEPVFRRAMQAPLVKFMVMIDELNATKMLGLVKRLVVDRYWSFWADAEPSLKGKIPDNVVFVGAVNPSKKSAALEGRAHDDDNDKHPVGETSDDVAELGFDVTPMPPSLMEHVVPWRQLANQRMQYFVNMLLRQSKSVFRASLPEPHLKVLAELLFKSHSFAQRECRNKRSTVSQRDIHRAMKIFDFFYNQGLDFTAISGVPRAADAEHRTMSAMLLAIGIAYYFRFPEDQRDALSTMITDLLLDANMPLPVPFKRVVGNAVAHFCSPAHLKLPDAVYAHRGLMENLYVQIVCFELRIGVILEGPPGTSKTLSNSIIRDNMTGSGPFWKDLCHIADICRYQGSSQSSADEIKRKCEDAYQKQKESDEAGMRHKRTLLFVDEAGLVKSETDDRKWALKVLHFYLEGANLASVLMTNQTLDPAIGNRCVVVYMGKPEAKELTNMCAGILCRTGLVGLDPQAREVVDKCCVAFHKLVPPMTDKEELVTVAVGERQYRWWYGLRDLFHMMRYIRRNQDGPPATGELMTVSPELVARSLQRNFNGPAAFFDEVLRVFGETLGASVGPEYSTAALRSHLLLNLEVILDSIRDNNRTHENASGKNLNDMWVRFKLVVDNSDDGSLLQLLRQKNLNIPYFKDIQVLRLSALSRGDKFMPVAAVSQIAAAMETGKTVWLTNTREIDACLFELFNQNFVVANSGEINHFAALAIGASLEYKRVHPDFQCVVHVMKKDLAQMGHVLPSPFLNRLEKFSIAVEDVLSWVFRNKPSDPSAALRKKLDDFDRRLQAQRSRPLFSQAPRETIASLVLEIVGDDNFGGRRDFPVAPRLANDHGLKAFIVATDPATAKWRRAALRLLQLFQLDHMLLAQQTLMHGANCFLRAYFRDLRPWSLSGYLNSLADEVACAGSEPLRAVVYAPANTQFLNIVEDVPRAVYLGIDALADSERGAKELKDRVVHFMDNDAKRVMCVVITPELLGSPEAREVRWLLDETLADDATVRPHKAVVILQSFRGDMHESRCTPLFGTGWNQVYIDASGDRLDIDMLRYVEPEIVGNRPHKSRVDEGLIAVLLPAALSGVMFSQSGLGWAHVDGADPAAALYDLGRSFDEQLQRMTFLLDACPLAKETFVELCRAVVPTPPELIKMAKDLAAEETSASLAQRLIDEEERVFMKLLAYVVQFMLDDRNASTILSALEEGNTTLVAFADSFMSRALQNMSSRTTFSYLRRKKLDTLTKLTVGPLAPCVPGSLYLMAHLAVPASQTDARQEAENLRAEHEGTMIGELVEQIHEAALTRDFLKDCVRCRMRMRSDINRLKLCFEWIFSFVCGLHKERFGDAPETVYTAHALCCVEGAAIDEYILAMLPLANVGILDNAPSPAAMLEGKASGDEEWITYDLCPRLLIESYDRLGREEFLTATSCLLHRSSREFLARSIPCLMMASAVLAGPGAKIDVVEFGRRCAAIPAPRLPLDLGLCNDMARTPQARARQALVYAELYERQPDEEELAVMIVLCIASGEVSRGMACRLLGTVFDVLRRGVELADNLRALECLAPVGRLVYDAVRPPLPADAAKYSPPGATALPQDPAYCSSAYTAVFDVVYDFCVGADAELLCGGNASTQCVALSRLHGQLSAQLDGMAVPERMLYTVALTAIDVAFLQCLGIWFQPPLEADKSTWAPSVVGSPDYDMVRAHARALTLPAGFVAPEYGTMEYTNMLGKTVDAACNYYTVVFIGAMERGVSQRVPGMGMKAVMSYAMEQVSNGLGALPTLFGPYMEFKCHGAMIPAATPGDLPFVFNQNDSLFGAYQTLHVQWLAAEDNRTSSDTVLGKIQVLLQDLCNEFQKAEVRLLLFYYAAKQYFMQKQDMYCARSIAMCDRIKKMLVLNDSQQRLLQLFLAPSLVEELVWSTALQAALKQRDAWVAMVCAVASVAAANPDTLLWMYTFEMHRMNKYYMPGDKTGGAVTPGGGFKLDCVTQLDASGKLFSFAAGQPVLSQGSCYLLWGIMFAAFSLQLGMSQDAHNIFSKSVFSPELMRKQHRTTLTTQDYLVERCVERSRAYHLYMAENTALSSDNARGIFAHLVYKFHTETESSKLRRYQNKSRQEALDVEREIEKIWQQSIKPATMGEFAAMFAEDGDGSSALRLVSELQRLPTELHTLPRTTMITTALGCLSGEEAPQLLQMALQQRHKLALLAPLLIEVFQFASEVHTFLSGSLPVYSAGATGVGEEHTSHRGVLEILEKHCHPTQYRRMRERMVSIKQRWNDYRDKVGSIDFECEEGGINIQMDESDTPAVGAAGLPDTLDFWIHMSDTSVDPDHKNLVHAAVLSLTSQYNECQRIIARYTNINLEPVHPAMLNPSKPDLVLTELLDLAAVCRSHVRNDDSVDWAAIEAEISFASGLIIPPMAEAKPLEFRFADEKTVHSDDVEAHSREELALKPDRHRKQLTDAQRNELASRARFFTEEQNVTALKTLTEAFTLVDVSSNTPLRAALQRVQQRAAGKFEASAFDGLTAGHLREVIRFFINKVSQADWKTARVDDAFRKPIPAEDSAAIERRCAEMMNAPDNTFMEDVEDVLLVLYQMAEQLDRNTDPAQAMTDPMREMMLILGSDGVVVDIFQGLRYENIVALITRINQMKKRLAKRAERRVWEEKHHGNTPDVPHLLYFDDACVDEDAACVDLTGLQCEMGLDGCIRVVAVAEDSPAAHAGLEGGMHVLRVGDTPVDTIVDYEAAMDARVATREPFEIGVASTATAVADAITHERSMIFEQSLTAESFLKNELEESVAREDPLATSGRQGTLGTMQPSTGLKRKSSFGRKMKPSPSMPPSVPKATREDLAAENERLREQLMVERERRHVLEEEVRSLRSLTGSSDFPRGDSSH